MLARDGSPPARLYRVQDRSRTGSVQDRAAMRRFVLHLSEKHRLKLSDERRNAVRHRVPDGIMVDRVIAKDSQPCVRGFRNDAYASGVSPYSVSASAKTRSRVRQHRSGSAIKST